MFDEEVAIARFLLCSNAIVFIVETAFANRIRPYVSHETMYLCIFYYLVANVASSRRQLPVSSRSVWACLTRKALCSIPLTSLLSLLYNFRHSIVDCIVHDTLGDAQSCRFGGNRLRCESFLLAAKRQTVQEGCASFVLGPFMATLYAILVFVLRFIPCFFGGVYFAFTFTEDRLYAQGSSLKAPTDRHQDRALPSTTFYLALALLLWGVFSLEISAGKHAEICTYTTLVFYGALFIIQVSRSQEGTSQEVNRVLQELQFVGSILLVFFVYMDFTRNAVVLASTCAELVDYKVLSECQPGDKVCLDTRNALSATFFSQYDCPQISADSTRHVYFYLGQILRLIVLAIVYPIALIYTHVQPDRSSGYGSGSGGFLKETIDKTPAEELKRILYQAVELDFEQQRH